MYDVSEVNIEKLGLQAACQQAYERGCNEIGTPAFHAGMDAGYACAMCGLGAASTVVNAWFNGDYTILLFADGEKEKVRFRHEDGAVYDREKAVMACILKHVIGNGYIAALREFVPDPHAGACVAPIRRAALLQASVLGAPDGGELAVGPGMTPVDMFGDGEEAPGAPVCYGEDDSELLEEGNGPVVPEDPADEQFEYGKFGM